MEYKDYYKTLGIDKQAAVEEIKKVYRKLARKYHPDVNPGDKSAEDHFKEISEAYQVLINPDARAKYDRLGASWKHHQQSSADDKFDWSQWVSGLKKDGQPVDPVDLNDILSGYKNSKSSSFSDFFEAVFGDMDLEQQEPESNPRKGEDYHQTVEITLEEAFGGTSRILRVGGRRLEVKIPKGAAIGTKVRIRGEGAEGVAGGAKGDLYLEIIVSPHSAFERINDDLYMDLPVNLYSAILGGEAIVPTIKGKIKLRIPPETQAGRTFRLKGQGMPKLKHPEERGDLYAKVVVTLPEELTEREIELFEELADIRGL
jgi:curved DNA-binding protein